MSFQTGEENKSTKLKNETIYGEERVTFRGIKIVYTLNIKYL